MCEGFRMPAATDVATGSGGRRPKASKGGNRGNGYVRPCRGYYGDLGAAGELADLDRADAASCSTVKRPTKERRIGSPTMNCRTF